MRGNFRVYRTTYGLKLNRLQGQHSRGMHEALDPIISAAKNSMYVCIDYILL